MSLPAPMAGVLALLSGVGKREKAEIPRGLVLVGGHLFSSIASRVIVGQNGSVNTSQASPL